MCLVFSIVANQSEGMWLAKKLKAVGVDLRGVVRAVVCKIITIQTAEANFPL